jgi:hypothetical protein
MMYLFRPHLETQPGSLDNETHSRLQHKYTALHAVVMTASNAILVGMTFWLMTWDELGLVPKAAVSLANFGLAAGRQQECQWGWLRKRRDPRDL